MKNVESSLVIDAPVSKVWAVLMDFVSFPEWNPTIPSLKGKPVAGEYLEAQLALPGKKPMIFKPMVLKCERNREFRWKGKLWVKGLFDGEHYFLLKPLPDNRTEFIQGENFTGLLSGIIFKMIGDETKRGFDGMNEALAKMV